MGQEIAFSLRSIENDIEFLDEMMDWWNTQAPVCCSIDVDPQFHVVVGLNHPPVEDPDALPMWKMDDGIIEGALSTRFAKVRTWSFSVLKEVETKTICGAT